MPLDKVLRINSKNKHAFKNIEKNTETKVKVGGILTKASFFPFHLSEIQIPLQTVLAKHRRLPLPSSINQRTLFLVGVKGENVTVTFPASNILLLRLNLGWV